MRFVLAAAFASLLAGGAAPAATVAKPSSLILFNLPYGDETGFGVIRPDGSGRTILSREYTVRGWSPDGRQIVALGYPPNRLVVLDESGALVRVLAGPADFFTPEWSPDGRWLAGYAGRCGSMRSYCADLWIIRADGGEQRRLVSAGVLALGAGELVDWAPDGRTLAYSGSATSVLAGRPRYTGIVLVSLTGRKVIRAAFRGGAEPDWAPHGDRIAFSRSGSIFVAGRDGRGLRRLTGKGRNIQPVWSPDGRKIAYLRTRRGGTDPRFEVQVLDLRRDRVARVAAVRAKVRLVWSPDSTRLLWADGDVVVARAAGSRRAVPLTEGDDPYWR